MQKRKEKTNKSIWSRFTGSLGLSKKTSTETNLDEVMSYRTEPHSFSSLDWYELSEDTDLSRRYFRRLQRTIYRQLDKVRATDNAGMLKTPVMFRETGELAGHRKYFFLQRPNEIGWMFERTRTGWVVSRCERIVSQGTFLRQGDAWDIVSLYSSKSHNIPPRVSSFRAGGEMISYLVYEQRVLKLLELDEA